MTRPNLKIDNKLKTKRDKAQESFCHNSPDVRHELNFEERILNFEFDGRELLTLFFKSL